MRDDNGKVHDLNSAKADRAARRTTSTPRSGSGQYGVTVLDHANGIATLAAHGQRGQGALRPRGVARTATRVYTREHQARPRSRASRRRWPADDGVDPAEGRRQQQLGPAGPRRRRQDRHLGERPADVQGRERARLDGRLHGGQTRRQEPGEELERPGGRRSGSATRPKKCRSSEGRQVQDAGLQRRRQDLQGVHGRGQQGQAGRQVHRAELRRRRDAGNAQAPPSSPTRNPGPSPVAATPGQRRPTTGAAAAATERRR